MMMIMALFMKITMIVKGMRMTTLPIIVLRTVIIIGGMMIMIASNHSTLLVIRTTIL